MKYQAPYGVSDANASYINGNPSIGLRGSIPPAASIEYPMREIVNAIVAAGLTPTDDDLLQLWKAMQLSPWLQEYAVDSGTADHVVVAITSAPPQLYPGMTVRVKIAYDSTGAADLTYNALGTNAIKHADGSDIGAGDLKNGMVAILIFDGSAWQMMAGGVAGEGGSTTTIKIPYSDDSGSVDHLVGTFTPTITSLVAGDVVLIKAEHVNTGGSLDLKCDALVEKSLVWPDLSAIQGGVIAVGMILLCVYDGSVFQLISSVGPGGGGTASGAPSGNGQCYLSLVGGNLVLKPENGNTLVINNTLQTVPAAGVALAPAGLSLGLNYIYAYMNSGVMTLEGVVTGHSVSTISGMTIKTGDETRTLVGMANVTTGPGLLDAEGTRNVLSYFNRKKKRSTVQLQTSISTTITSWFEVSSELRHSFITWGDSPVDYSFFGTFHASMNGSIASSIGWDGSLTPDPLITIGEINYVQNSCMEVMSLFGTKTDLAEGAHIATLLGISRGPGYLGWYATWAGIELQPSRVGWRACGIMLNIWG